MDIETAFLGSNADDLFSSVAAFGDARALEVFDVPNVQTAARQAIDAAIDNALNPRTHNPGSRLALIKGEAGSGKSHVLTVAFKHAATNREVYPAIVQLTAPVRRQDYEIWLLDATIRQLSARHFVDDDNQSPLRRLAGRLLGRLEIADREQFLSAVEDSTNNEDVLLSLRLANCVLESAKEQLDEPPPDPGFLAVLLLAGFGDSAALAYLRHGRIRRRLEELELDDLRTPTDRLRILENLGLAAQIVGASLALGFDQVENTIRLGSEDLFVHTITQAVRVAETILNCAVVIVALADEYDDIVGGRRESRGLPVSDRDRIEREAPKAVRLEQASPDLLRAIIERRFTALRHRTDLPQASGSLDPLPSWLVDRVLQARNVRSALHEVASFRQRAIEMGRLPTQQEYEGDKPAPPVPPPESADFDKEWADFQDLAPATVRLLTQTKGELIAWWVEQASHEHLHAEPARVALSYHDGDQSTPIVDISLNANGVVIERRQLALCEAPNRNYQLANEIETFLAAADGVVPYVLRTNGFPKGRQTQPAAGLRKLESLSGLKLDLNVTEWHNLYRAKEFWESRKTNDSFLQWRRDQQWLTQLIAPLQSLIALPEIIDLEIDGDQLSPPITVPTEQPPQQNGFINGAQTRPPTVSPASDPFPVQIGTSFDGAVIQWDPYRDSPNHLNNFSVLISGDAGSGKTQTIRVLIDAACRRNLAVTIFDFKADYCDADFAGPLGIEVIDVHARGLPFNPLQPPPRGASGVQPIEHAYEIAGVLKRVFGLGAVQEGLLRNVINDVYRGAEIDPREWIDPTATIWPTFDLVLDRLRDDRQAAAMVSKLSVLVDLGLFQAGANPRISLEDFLNKRVCLKLSDLPTDEIKSALAEVLIVQLHGYALRGEQPRRLTRLMVFDEAHRVKDSKRLESLAREGRAFGVGIVIGTQFPGDIQDSMAGNLATQLFLMNNQANHRRYVAGQLLGTTGTSEAHHLLDQLSRLRPLEGIFSNTHHRGLLVRVLPHYARQANGPPPVFR
jgi:Helicase HerA, central domain